MRWDDDSDPGDRGHTPEGEPFYTLGLGSLLSPLVWIGLPGGLVLVVWGITWLTIGEPLGVVLMVLGVAVLAWTVWRLWRAYRGRRKQPPPP